MTAPIAKSWKRITAWLRANAPGVPEQFQAPVTPEELASAGKKLGVELPDDFAQLYQVVNGTDPDDDSAAIFPSADEWDDMAFGPLALQQVVREWQMQRKLLKGGDFAGREPQSDEGVASDWWNVGWIPFAGNGGGDYYCVDTAPTGAGTRGQVITHSHESGEHKSLAPSLAHYLSDLADALEAGQYEYDEDYGIRRRDADE
jgi:cell wall assembly regulator SMI1